MQEYIQLFATPYIVKIKNLSLFIHKAFLHDYF